MSWKDFYRLIDEQNTDIAAWMAAIKANPNTPRDALKVALLDILQKEDMAMLEKLTGVMVDLIRNADGLLDTILEQDGFPVSLGEPVVVIGQDGPGEKYDMPGLFDLSGNGASAPVVSLS